MVSLKFTLLSLIAIVSATAGCHPDPSTFGMQVTVERPDGTKSHNCLLSGNAQGGTSERLDRKGTTKANAFPHFWLTEHQMGENTPYIVEVFTVSSYVGDTAVPAEKVLLTSRSYDEAFGQAGKTDSLHVTFENESYEVQIKGLPSSATSCSF